MSESHYQSTESVIGDIEGIAQNDRKALMGEPEIHYGTNPAARAGLLMQLGNVVNSGNTNVENALGMTTSEIHRGLQLERQQRVRENEDRKRALLDESERIA